MANAKNNQTGIPSVYMLLPLAFPVGIKQHFLDPSNLEKLHSALTALTTEGSLQETEQYGAL